MSQTATCSVLACTPDTNPDPGWYDILVLAYGMRCPLRCDFCCHAGLETYPEQLDPRQAIDLIQQAAGMPTVKLVVFTGGEPFLYYRDLLEILQATQHFGLPVRIVTAAHWASSPKAARSKLEPLVERGLTELSVSTDPSHQEFVPAGYAENAAKAALELGLACEIAAVLWDTGLVLDDFVQVPEGAGRVVHLAAPIGRGCSRRVTPTDYGVSEDRFSACGLPNCDDIMVYPDGEVFPCCSGGFNRQAGLSMGNVGTLALAEIIRRIHTDPYVRLVRHTGIRALYEICRFRFPEIQARLPDQSGMVAVCQLCAAVHGDGELRRRIEPVIDYLHELTAALDSLRSSACITAPVEAP